MTVAEVARFQSSGHCDLAKRAFVHNSRFHSQTMKEWLAYVEYDKMKIEDFISKRLKVNFTAMS